MTKVSSDEGVAAAQRQADQVDSSNLRRHRADSTKAQRDSEADSKRAEAQKAAEGEVEKATNDVATAKSTLDDAQAALDEATAERDARAIDLNNAQLALAQANRTLALTSIAQQPATRKGDDGATVIETGHGDRYHQPPAAMAID